MIDYILELAQDLDEAVLSGDPAAAFFTAKPLVDELNRFDATEFIPEVRAAFARIRSDVRRMCTDLRGMPYKEIWAEDYPQLKQLVKGYVGKRGQPASKMDRPVTVNLIEAHPGSYVANNGSTINIQQHFGYALELHRMILDAPKETISETARKTALNLVGDAMKDIAKGQVKEAAKQIVELGKDVLPLVAQTAAYGFFKSMLAP